MAFNVTNISRPYEMLQVADSITNHMFGIVFAILTFTIALLYLATSERPFGYAFAVSSFMTTILVILMRTLNIVPDWIVFMSVIMTIGGVAYTVFSKKE